MAREIPMPGQVYRHFKNNLYQILTVAEHTETREQLVIYQSLYGDFKVYARPLTMFLSEVDKEKYPEVQQQYRFELVTGMGMCATEKAEQEDSITCEAAETATCSNIELEERMEQENDTEGMINPLLLQFLDTDTYAEKLEVLTSIRNQLDNRLIDDIATVIDVVIEEGSLSARYESLKSCIETMEKFECARLR